MAAQADLCLAWSETPENTFCRVVAHIIKRTYKLYSGWWVKIGTLTWLIEPDMTFVHIDLLYTCVIKGSIRNRHIKHTKKYHCQLSSGTQYLWQQGAAIFAALEVHLSSFLLMHRMHWWSDRPIQCENFISYDIKKCLPSKLQPYLLVWSRMFNFSIWPHHLGKREFVNLQSKKKYLIHYLETVSN